MDIAWSQLTQLGVGGLFAVTILWMTFKFLMNRKNGTEKILMKMDASELKLATAMESVAGAIQALHLDLIKEMNNGRHSRSDG